jgi:NAD(P)-dependent dehydrogenase (short-subunit alcohol dehydrogenase family)
LAKSACDSLGGLDILVCNAGIMQIGGVLDITSEQWRRVLDVNLTGTFHSCRAALPRMLEQGSGSIVNIASTTGLRTGGERVAYSSSKFGVVGLTQALASELAPRGIRVNCVCPSFVRSGMSIGELMLQTGIDDPQKADALWTKVGQKQGVLGRSVEPSDIGRAVVWLCESDMVVGIALPVTGGDGLPGLSR